MHETKPLLLALLALGAFAAGPAAADTLQLHFASASSALATEVHLPLGTQNYLVGNYRIETLSPATSFVAYCIDPFQYATTAYTTYQRTPGASFFSTASGKLADVTALFSHAYAGTLGNATKAAGFQLALWEVVNDDRNLSSGQVMATARTNAAALAEAQGLLASLATSTWSSAASDYELVVYSSPTQQDFLAASPVPEPDTPLLMLFGLSMLTLALRGRATTRKS